MQTVDFLVFLFFTVNVNILKGIVSQHLLVGHYDKNRPDNIDVNDTAGILYKF